MTSRQACSLKISVEEQCAQKYDRFLRRRQIASTIYDHFCATGAYQAVQGLSDLFSARLQNDDVQDFDVRWCQALLSGSDGKIVQVKITGLSSASNVLALYDQETVRNNGQTSYLPFKTSVKLHIDQTNKRREDADHGGS